MREKLAGLVFILFMGGCAQAIDDGGFGPGRGDASTADSGASSTDSGGSKDSTTSPDSSSKPDTYVEDTYVEDTYVEDTYVPPVDVGSGTCLYCSTGVCPVVLIDYSCLLNCLLDGHLDCNYDATKSTPCTCLD